MKVYYQAPINEQFNDSYNQRGLQPSTGGVTPIRNVTVEYKNNDPKKRRGGKQEVRKLGGTAARKTTGYSMQATGAGMQAGGKATKAGGRAAMSAGVALSSTGVGAVVGVPLAVAGAGATAAGAGMDAAGKATRKAGKAVSRTKTKKVLSVIKPPTSTLGVFGMIWPLGLWLFVQLPFAILSLFFLAVTQIVYGLFQNVPPTDERTTLEEVAGIATEVIVSAFRWVSNQLLDLIGLSLDDFSPAPLMMLSIFVCLIVGVITILVKSLTMTLKGQSPFFGKGAGIKILALVVALVGYSFPFFNMFPWYIPWQWIVSWSSK